MEVLIAGRQEGKTVELMEWVSEGVRCDGYPGWTHVAIVPTMDRLLQIKSIWWETFEDFDHRVYYLKEVIEGRFTSIDTKYRFDDMDLILRGLFPSKNIDGFTMTGQLWRQG